MKRIRFTAHAEENLTAREIPREEAELTVRNPIYREPGRLPRETVSRLYFDSGIGEQMLLRVIIEETAAEITVVTLYKTSKLKKYLPEEKDEGPL